MPTFPYNTENTPPLSALRKHLFGVHVTQVLPHDNVMKAGALYYDEEGKVRLDLEAPAFRPTIHFALNNVVPKNESANWSDIPYALVCPLVTLEDQLINVFPYNTFILGDFSIPKGSYWVVPEDTEIQGVGEGVQVITYPLQENIASAVNQLIQRLGGWQIALEEGQRELGAFAEIEGVDVSQADFYQALFEAYPYLSFGRNNIVERGEADCFGVIGNCLRVMIMENYKKTTDDLLLFRKGVDFHIERVNSFLQILPFPKEVIENVKEKMQLLRYWLNVVDVDIYLRQHQESILLTDWDNIADLQSIVLANKHDYKEMLQKVLDSEIELISATQTETFLSSHNLTDILQTMHLSDCRQFLDKNKALIGDFDLPTIYVRYATRRLLNRKEKITAQHPLCQLLQDNLLLMPKGEHRNVIFEEMEIYFQPTSNKLEDMVQLINLPEVKHYLQQFEVIKGEEVFTLEQLKMIIKEEEKVNV